MCRKTLYDLLTSNKDMKKRLYLILTKPHFLKLFIIKTVTAIYLPM